MPSIGANIKRLREAAGLSQVELAAKLKITNVWLCEIESGRQEPSLDLLRAAAKKLGVEPGELLK